LGAKGNLLAGVQIQYQIDGVQGAWPVSNHHDRPSALADGPYCFRKRLIALGIQVRIAFVKHHQRRVTVKGSCQRYSLPLAR